MEYEGMVHALEEIHRLLKPGGCLVDIHPIPEAPLVEVIKGSSVLLVEPDPAYDYEEDIRQAEVALALVIQRRLYILEQSKDFEVFAYASSVPELMEYLEQASEYIVSAKDPEVEAQIRKVYARVEEKMRTAGAGVEVAIHERARISRLLPVNL
jgi:SAM-dependent methyltransferase